MHHVICILATSKVLMLHQPRSAKKSMLLQVCCIAPGYIDTEMPPEDMNHASMIKASDIAEICTMPFKLSIGCIPQLIVLRNAEILD